MGYFNYCSSAKERDYAQLIKNTNFELRKQSHITLIIFPLIIDSIITIIVQ